MTYFKNVLNMISDRQLNVRNSMNSSYYARKIIKSYYECSNNLYHLTREFDESINLVCFSEDNNFFATDDILWKLNEELTFPTSSQIINLHKNEVTTEAITINKDSSKFILAFDSRKSEIEIIDILTSKTTKKFEQYSNNISCCPTNTNIFSSCSFITGIYIYDLRCSKHIKSVDWKDNFCSEYKPLQENLLLVSGYSKNEIFLLDLRNLKPVFHYKILYNCRKNYSYAKFNRKGTQIFAMRKQQNPVLFNLNDSYPIYEFDEHGFFINSFNLSYKTPNCTFAGIEDEYVVAPSDNGKVFIWEIPENSFNLAKNNQITTRIDTAKFILDHNSPSIKLDYNYERSVLVCSGNQKTLKFWSPLFKTPNKKIKQPFYFDKPRGPFMPYTTNKGELSLNSFNFSLRLLNIKGWGLNKSYFNFYCNNFDDINSKCFLQELNEDLVINYIKTFVEYYHNTIKKRNEIIKKKFKTLTRKNLDYKELIVKEDLLSLFYEFRKTISTKNFLLESADYLKYKLEKIEKLKKKFFECEETYVLLMEDFNFLIKIELILKSLLVDIENILILDNKMIENPLEDIKKLFIYHQNYFFSRNGQHLPLNKYFPCLIENQKTKVILETIEKSIISSIKNKKKLKLFDDEYNQSFETLKENLNKKKKMNN